MLTSFSGIPTSMTLKELEPQNNKFSDFFAILFCGRILGVNCAETAGDRPRKPAYKIFGIKRRL